MSPSTLNTLIASSTPFLRIDDVRLQPWRRNVQMGSRIGPWQYQANFTVLDEQVWSRKGEVLYFVTDGASRLRLVGESSKRLKDRWRMSPMHDITTRASLGQHALFHSTAWGAIERGLGQESPPFVVSALFVDVVEQIVPRESMLPMQGKRNHHCLRVEQAIIRTHRDSMSLWNS